MEIRTSESDSSYRFAPDRTLILERMQRSDGVKELFDAFPTYWSVAFADLPNGLISVRTRGQLIESSGPVMVICPPNSLVNWVFHGPFEIKWSALLLDRDYPAHWPARAMSCPWDSEKIPQNFQELAEIVECRREGTWVDKTEIDNVIARRLKQAIDREYASEKSLVDYAAELALHSDVITRYFKQDFGLTPLDYRTHLRLWYSMWSLVFDQANVTQVAQRSGFRSLKNFYTLFSRYTSLKPRDLRQLQGVRKRDSEPELT